MFSHQYKKSYFEITKGNSETTLRGFLCLRRLTIGVRDSRVVRFRLLSRPPLDVSCTPFLHRSLQESSANATRSGLKPPSASGSEGPSYIFRVLRRGFLHSCSPCWNPDNLGILAAEADDLPAGPRRKPVEILADEELKAPPDNVTWTRLRGTWDCVRIGKRVRLIVELPHESLSGYPRERRGGRPRPANGASRH
jgi:hypothetical protein